MKVQNVIRTFVGLNMALAGLLIAFYPAMAASTNLADKSESVSPSSILIAQEADDEIDVAALEEAAEQMEQAADALQAADESEDDAEEAEFFETAIASMDAAADSLESAGIPDAASAMDDFTNAVAAADAAETEEEEQE